MFPNDTTDSSAPSYDLLHKHFLATRPLLHRPGSRYDYSNHGMGLTTLVIEEATGASYRSYTRNQYLAPMGLNGHIRPQTVANDSRDSFAYDRTGNNNHVLRPFKNSEAGLAAGGWTAPAQGIVAVTSNLAESYGYDMMDDAAFRSESKGKLEHGGSIEGGRAYVAVFPTGYVSNSGVDLSDIHVAIASNTNGLKDGISSRMESLASTIALETGMANLPEFVDYWPEAW